MNSNGIRISDWVKGLGHQQDFYMAVVDKFGRLTFLNAHFFKNLCLTSTSLIDHTLFDFIHPNDLKGFKNALDECSGQSEMMTTEWRMKNGHNRWVKWEVTQLKRPETEKVKFLCLGYDIPCDSQIKKYANIGDQNYRAIVEDLSIGVIFHDKEGTLISANQKSAEIFETELETLYAGRKSYSGWKITTGNGEPFSFADAPHMKALSTGQTQTNVQLNLQVKEGIFRSVLINSQPLFEKDESSPFSVVSTILDITNEKKLEAEIRMRENLFTSFMNHTPYFTWIVDKDKKLIFANQSLLQYFHGDETAFGHNIFDLIPYSIASAFHEKHERVLKTNLSDHSIIKSLMADGKEHVYQITVFPIHGGFSEMMVGGEALDITEGYNARQEIKRANEHLIYLSKATLEAIWDWNMQTGHIYCNEILHEMIGSGLNEVFDLDWCFQSIHIHDREKVERKIKTVLENKEQSWEVEFRFQNKNGDYVLVCNRGFVIYENGTPVRMLGSMQDITKVKELETELVEQKLKQQKGIAEAIIQSQEEERTRIGHELHDNVNQILSTAQLYLRLLDPTNVKFLDIKAKVMETVLLGIEEIRKLSKEMVMPNLRGNGLIASINDIVTDLRLVNPFRIVFNHDLQCEIESISNSKKINIFRIVQEQIKNIIKYSKANNVEISLRCSNNQLRLLIEDDGIGFDSKNTRRGIGLSNIYERTRLDSGKVILKTSPGNGCSLLVNIPVDPKSVF